MKVLEAPDEEMLQLRRGEFEVLKTAPWPGKGRGRPKAWENVGKIWGKSGKMWKKLGDSGIHGEFRGNMENIW